MGTKIQWADIEREERYCEIAASRMAQGVLDFGTANATLHPPTEAQRKEVR